MRPTTLAICALVAEHYGLTVEELVGRGRTKTVAEARKVAMIRARSELGLSWRELAIEFGRDESTCIAAVKGKKRATASTGDRARPQTAGDSRMCQDGECACDQILTMHRARARARIVPCDRPT